MQYRTVIHLAKGQGQPRSTSINLLTADGRRYMRRPRPLMSSDSRAEVEAVLKTVSVLGLRTLAFVVVGIELLYNKRELSWEHLGIVTAST